MGPRSPEVTSPASVSSSSSKVLTGDEFHDPTNMGRRASKAIPTGGGFSVYSAAVIRAPPKYVYDAIVNVGAWKEWTSFVRDVTIQMTHARPIYSNTLRMERGSHMRFDVQLTPTHRTSSREVCTDLESLRLGGIGRGGTVTTIRWSLDNAASLLPPFVLRAERTNEIDALPDGKSTAYRTWQVFAGVSSSMVRSMYGNALRERFQDWAHDLKERAEEMYARDRQAEGGPAAGGDAMSDLGDTRSAISDEGVLAVEPGKEMSQTVQPMSGKGEEGTRGEDAASDISDVGDAGHGGDRRSDVSELSGRETK